MAKSRKTRSPRVVDELRTPKVVGITCGIGSMMVGAKAAGFEVVGNVEWRSYYHDADEQGRNTYTANFPNTPFPYSLERMTEEEFERFSNADFAMGHPECGNFSRLSSANKNAQEKLFDPADIPLFCDIVERLKPRFFVMDDLPRSLMAFPMEKYAEKLPDYDLFPEWISNWGYGNPQHGRDRMFMIGSLKSERWAFRPGEREHTTYVKDVIGDLPKPRKGSNFPNHDPHQQDADCFRALNLGGFRKKSTWGDVAEYFRDKPGGFTLGYETSEEKKAERIAKGLDPVVKRIGFLKGHWDGWAHVLTGGNATVHNKRCEPYTVRERARIQGFPDDFVFYGTILNKKGEWNHDENQHIIRQTGKAMPIQFCTYVSEQIMAHIRGEEFECSGQRVKPSNENVDEAKQWYCQNVGYADQEKACASCWLAARCSIRTEKYGMAPIPGKVRAAAAPRTRTSSPRAARPPKVYKQVETQVVNFKGE